MAGYFCFLRLQDAQKRWFMYWDGGEGAVLCCGGPHSSQWPGRTINFSAGDFPSVSEQCAQFVVRVGISKIPCSGGLCRHDIMLVWGPH